MTSLSVLLCCALVPLALCALFRRMLLSMVRPEPAAADRDQRLLRQVTLVFGAVAAVVAGVLGAITTDPELLPRWPVTAAWLSSSLCIMTVWATIALYQRTSEEAHAIPWTETVGRAVQSSALGVIATGVSVAFAAGVQPILPLPPGIRTLVFAALAVAGVVVLSPWLLMMLGLWEVFRGQVEVDGIRWRVAHLPTPTPLVTHVAALPWLRTVLISDGLRERVPEKHWRTLVSFEIGEATTSRMARARRWFLAVPLSFLVFVAAHVASEGDPKKLVAATSLAATFTLGAAWIANRDPGPVSMDACGPSPRDLARTLRHLPPPSRQVIPRTSHRALGPALYDRLFALGHDPGPRPGR